MIGHELRASPVGLNYLEKPVHLFQKLSHMRLNEQIKTREKQTGVLLSAIKRKSVKIYAESELLWEENCKGANSVLLKLWGILKTHNLPMVQVGVILPEYAAYTPPVQKVY